MAKKGFTLIELLIVISIIAILASVVFVALDPLKRFQDARDSSRWADISAVVSAIKVYQVDNSGNYPSAITSMTSGTVYMIGTGTTGCDDNACDVTIGGDTNCVDLADLVTGGYLGEVPVSPNGVSTWSDDTTGYVLTRYATGIVKVQACESENSESISISK
ncbi:MAG: hypothetical protein COX80_03915 [Candidatus Magasanikbacteria bacterium CG_4_10_14_0_2_um_filter_33_14]|uniref:Type II secretion system protein GspG C-terminal domain-containing protein n=1 Tax=Candidatus Magasanikbacteria bacterium CG_4_10_14_0_2_um_filter_33_14 TaxID=1974636 RepID=A0A2M7V9T0_9BACT|nr:MAG: hypothetical protein COX80_03915 [Candidatus Magasanikbacteria bacterium CG_4_10_14_0_2_um_filter_33_14]